MYIHEIHIFQYFIFGIIGLIIGQLEDYLIVRLQDHESIISSDFKVKYLPYMKINLVTMYLTAIGYVAALYYFGYTLRFLKYLLLIPIFISIIFIDIKKQIIPNRLSMFLYYIGIVFAVIEGFTNVNIFFDKLLGMAAGGGIFLAITLIGGLIAGKEAMGFGDVKLMAALGLIFGLQNIIIISLTSFLLGSIISILLIATKRKTTDEYIPFGPFIIIAALLVMFIPEQVIMHALFKIFTLGTYKG